MTKLKPNQAYQVAPKQEQTLTYQCYQAFLYNWPNRYRLLDKIKRHGIIAEEQLTEKTTYLGEKAKKLLRVILKMIFRGGKAVVKQKYLYAITKCCAKQNRRLLNELLDFIQFKKIQVWEGRKISHYYSITLSASLQEEIKAVELENENSNGTKMSRSIYNRKSSKEDLDLSRVREELNPNLNISNSNNPTCCNKELQSDTTESADTDKVGGKKESLSVVPSPSSKRLSEGKTFKKHKIRNQKTVVFPWRKYQKPKTLSDMLPVLTDRICQEIIAKSGRLDFTVNFITQTVEKLAKKPDVNPIFHSLKGFIAYMSWCIKHELHDAVKCSNDRFRFKCNIEEENQQEGSVGIIPNPSKNLKNKPLRESPQRESLDLPDTLLGKIRRRLIELYEDNGVALDNHWFSKMQPVIDEREKTFKLSASSEVIVDWIKNNCWQRLKVATASVGLELVEV